MSNVYFISDLHLGHQRVLTFCDNFRTKALQVDTIEQHDEKICDLWNDVIKKRDTVYVLGDLGKNIEVIKKLPGTKKLLLGNHDTLKASEYLNFFDDIIGPITYKKHWLSHHPVHETELYGKRVIHGHTHSKGIEDSMYINVCVEMTRGVPVSFFDIKNQIFTTHEKVNKRYEDIK